MLLGIDPEKLLFARLKQLVVLFLSSNEEAFLIEGLLWGQDN